MSLRNAYFAVAYGTKPDNLHTASAFLCKDDNSGGYPYLSDYLFHAYITDTAEVIANYASMFKPDELVNRGANMNSVHTIDILEIDWASHRMQVVRKIQVKE